MKKNGFTLIELLAVIVIMAIIALISTPIIMNIIDNSRKGALKDSAYGIINAAELYYTANIAEGLNNDLEFICNNNKCMNESKQLKYSGSIKNGTVILKKDSKVLVCIDDGINYAMKLADDSKVTIGKGVCGSYNIEEGSFDILSDVSILVNTDKISENSDIEIISNTILTTENKGRKLINSTYTSNTITNYIELPNNNSTVSYKFKVKNKLNDVVKITNIKKESYNNEKIKYEITNFDIENDIIPANGEIELNIKFSWENYDSSNTILSSMLKFDFAKERYQLVINSNYPGYESITETVLYDQTKTYTDVIPSGYGLNSNINCTNKQNGAIKNSDFVISNIRKDTICTINVVSSEKLSFSYTGNQAIYIVPKDGTYKFQLWGSQGATHYGVGGKGSYTEGLLDAKKDDVFYVYVGEGGTDKSVSVPYGTHSFNGASSGSYTCYAYYRGASAQNVYGGSATDIRLVPGDWNDFNSLKSRIMIAAGGAAGNQYQDGAAGGALNGNNGSYTTGGTQTSSGGPNVGGFGYGGTPTYNVDCNGNTQTGAGSGYYGGGGSNRYQGMYSAGSGSSFISGYPGCNAIAESSTVGNIIHTNQPNHYSNKVFSNYSMVAGDGNMLTHDGTSTMKGNEGNGYAKITLLKND